MGTEEIVLGNSCDRLESHPGENHHHDHHPDHDHDHPLLLLETWSLLGP